jgi:predicted dehydrogenase
MTARTTDRRRFLTAAAGATLTANAYAAVVGSNDRLRIGLIGCGGRAQAHRHVLQSRPDVRIAAVCDVWDGHEDRYASSFGGSTSMRSYSQGRQPTAVHIGLNPDDTKTCVADYRRLLDGKLLDAVCIATPDHWHAKQAIDAFAAGLHVFVERPIAISPKQAEAVRAAAAASRLTVSVGVQSLADPGIALGRAAVAAIGPAVHLTGGAFKNDARGLYRYYRVVPEMNRRTIDWDLFLGHGFTVAGEPVGPSPATKRFTPEAFAQWRCEADFSRGLAGDLLNPVITRLLACAGVRQVVKGMTFGTLHHERDGRTVPDGATVVAEFAEGCHLAVTATSLSHYPVEEVVRGRHGAVKLVKGGAAIYRDDPAKGTTYPPRWERPTPPAETKSGPPPANETAALWDDFFANVRAGSKETLCPPDLAAAAVIATGTPC